MSEYVRQPLKEWHEIIAKKDVEIDHLTAEVERLKDANAQLQEIVNGDTADEERIRAENATLTARVAELEKALEVIATPKLLPSFGDPMVLRDYARAALTPQQGGE